MRASGDRVMLRPEYLAQKLTPYPLPTKDGGVLRTIGDALLINPGNPRARNKLSACVA
jgi:hypothetical protein